ncbi:uncharacterized protein LOC130641320 [Hydractinia symbiolongicarpus]|uniref:uncharacterized protein LOC130641320 n=1 Tax=Hydractinia symbiolongicarpus TaxID=13093 RepID=UPI002549E4D1|nr:uncharacterized protein LOC130641320 [Hydractinia symbiolongicarpus]
MSRLIVSVVVAITCICIVVGQNRPSWAGDTTKMLDKVAKDNNWSWNNKRSFDKAHIFPWQKTQNIVAAYQTPNGFDDAKMKQFVRDITQVHTDAAYVQNLDPKTRTEYENLAKKYRDESLKLIDKVKTASNDNDRKAKKQSLLRKLFNSPANLFPGDRSTNRAIGARLDPPFSYYKTEKGKIVRTGKITELSAKMLSDYALTAFEVGSERSKRYRSSDGEGNNDDSKQSKRGNHDCSKRKRRSLGGCGVNLDDKDEKKKTKTKDDGKNKKQRSKKRFRWVISSRKSNSNSRRSFSKSRFRTKGFGKRGKGTKIGVIDFTGGWIPKHHKDHLSGKITDPHAKAENVNGGKRYLAHSGGISGEVRSGYSKAQGSLGVGASAYAGKEGAHVKIHGPSGQASSHGFGVGGDISVKAGVTDRDNHLKAGLEGPSASFNIGPFGGGIGIGAGFEVSKNIKKGVGAKIDTPKGSFGAKVGCITELCFIGCLSLKFC